MTNETPHWVKPQLVAQVRFTEWTDEGRLRHPAYLGLRDDVDPKAVRREPGGTLVKEAEARLDSAARHNHEGTKARRHEGRRRRRAALEHVSTSALEHLGTPAPRHSGT